MPRIRTIKPEFWTSEQVIECSTNARLLFVGLWNFCDDSGRHPLSPKQCKAEVFPADDITLAEVEALLEELIENELIVPYSNGKRRYFFVPGWKHQKIDRPQDPKYPDPFDDHSTIDQRSFDDHSSLIGRDRKGMDSKGLEGSGIVDKSPTPSEPLGQVAKVSSVQKNPPSVADVQQYMADQGYPDQSEAFVDHYTANGWVQGRGKPIKDWQAAVRNWQRNDFSAGGRGDQKKGFAII